MSFSYTHIKTCTYMYIVVDLKCSCTGNKPFFFWSIKESYCIDGNMSHDVHVLIYMYLGVTKL